MKWLAEKLFVLVICLCCSLFSCIYAQHKTITNEVSAVKDNSKKECVISGEVSYPSGLLPSIEITFKGQQVEKSTVSNNEGAYNIKLSVGVYEITLKRGVAFMPYKRSKLDVSCESNLTVNLYPQFERISYGDKSPEHKFILFSDQWTSDKRLNLVISYLNKEKKENTVIHTDAMFTYNNLTISADKLIQNFKKKTITAKGNVWLEDGEKRTNYEKLTVKFSKNGVEIEGKENSSPEK